jgi:outer membrane protein assembly factor BamE (lipoprotein component of BamABCDE complex)
MRDCSALRAGLLAFVVAAGLSGCTGQGQGGQQAITNDTKVSQIQKGSSTKADIAGLFGQPGGKSFGASGDETWNYSFSSTQVNPATYVPIVGVFAGGATASASTLIVTFDQKGVVQAYSTNTVGNTVGNK